ncbi:MAG: A/G-specific adenine glycosylase [Flavobacterium sp.]
MTFTKRLIDWYISQKRDLPWRNTIDPYTVWLSEIILQQTRVNQGLPYFLRFLEAFPKVENLANADEQEVLKLWQGLGYYSRARNLHHTAKWIVEHNHGVFPKNYQSLQTLKGVGKYTAAAIASFCYKEPVPVVDGNVYRVLSRFFEIETDISSSEAFKVFFETSESIMDAKRPDLFNQAIMEFGAMHCVPVNPNCQDCIFNDSCAALKKNKVNSLPIKLKKTKVQNRFLNYLIPIDEKGNTIVLKRTTSGYWKHLFEFPLIESSDLDSDLDFQITMEDHWNGFSFKDSPVLMHTPAILHKLSHRNLFIHFWRVDVKGVFPNGVDFETLKSYPFPIVIYNFIKKNF